MSTNEKNEKTKKKEFNIWDAEGNNVFVKAKTDWFSTKYDSRLHLSFVRHSGKDTGSKQLLAIEIGLPMVKAGSDGDSETGITALALASLINSGTLTRMAQASRENAIANKKKYADDIFCCIGGTTVKRSKTGVAEFRKLSIAPSNKGSGFVLTAASCEGESSKELAGVQPKKDAKWETILVRVSEYYMRTLAGVILTEWQAFLTAKAVQDAMGIVNVNYSASDKIQPETYSVPQKSTQEVKEKKKSDVWVFMDEVVFGVMGTAITPMGAISKAQECFAKLKEKGFICSDMKIGVQLKDSIMKSGETRGAIDDAGIGEWLSPLNVPLVNPQTGEVNSLHVMVTRDAG